MAWKLKKSKVEENGETPDAASPVVVTHGHQGSVVQTKPEIDTDDFFGARLEDVDRTIAYNGAHSTPFDDDPTQQDTPAFPRPDNIPIVQSAFVTSNLDDDTEHELGSNGIAREPIDFGDVEFNLGDEPETIEFGHAEQEPEVEHLGESPAGTSFDIHAPIDMPAAAADEIEDPDKTVMTGQAAAPSIAAPIADDPDKTVMTGASPIADMSAAPSLGIPKDIDQTIISPPAAPADPDEAIAAGAPAVKPSISPAPVSAPRGPLPTKLVVKLGPFSAEQDLAGIGTDMLIGRPDYNTGVTPAISVELDDAISRRHARIVFQDGQYRIEDLGSKNGTMINGQPLMPNVSMPFNIGDIVRVGERTEITLK